MLEGLYAAAAGMSAQQQQLDTVANNLANVSTDGYHSEQVAFSDLLYNDIDETGTDTKAGAGAAARMIGTSEAAGALQQTGNPFDLALDGPGYFELKQAGGQTVLTRDGSFATDSQGRLVNAEGAFVQPPITVPKGVSPQQVTIAPNGVVSAGGKTLGKLAIVDVAAPNGLLAAGGGQFTPTAASGAPQPAKGTTVIQGSVEGSNVDLGNEMAMMMSAERTYAMNSSSVQMQDQMMSIANQLISS
ncbi:MAG TPA: flagellar hook-basal body protein [Solirubrobacteraceae bacterium]|jgi:flagellar basal-body rod protein FlgG